ncbi:hypothetical protein HETIRDRAFT_105391 [Heterobasidion irregulare TC 32-1]|uniref:Uncharacterized protein n=1 Tax=Heterobasidion irregulare (strain TC 32-1) TaxID=747525 RepID=W4JWM1_HETIT|nr:uncharacterized protein HETIRDRAFT_105391 [Heterobasidion irregulare TC 32-1]ETW77490.1 hypothetical protein HETIRDRAFT_105391 [Heterobasidion irregulare TC 32-1]
MLERHSGKTEEAPPLRTLNIIKLHGRLTIEGWTTSDLSKIKLSSRSRRMAPTLSISLHPTAVAFMQFALAEPDDREEHRDIFDLLESAHKLKIVSLQDHAFHLFCARLGAGRTGARDGGILFPELQQMAYKQLFSRSGIRHGEQILEWLKRRKGSRALLKRLKLYVKDNESTRQWANERVRRRGGQDVRCAMEDARFVGRIRTPPPRWHVSAASQRKRERGTSSPAVGQNQTGQGAPHPVCSARTPRSSQYQRQLDLHHRPLRPCVRGHSRVGLSPVHSLSTAQHARQQDATSRAPELFASSYSSGAAKPDRPEMALRAQRAASGISERKRLRSPEQRPIPAPAALAPRRAITRTSRAHRDPPARLHARPDNPPHRALDGTHALDRAPRRPRARAQQTRRAQPEQTHAQDPSHTKPTDPEAVDDTRALTQTQTRTRARASRGNARIGTGFPALPALYQAPMGPARLHARAASSQTRSRIVGVRGRRRRPARATDDPSHLSAEQPHAPDAVGISAKIRELARKESRTTPAKQASAVARRKRRGGGEIVGMEESRGSGFERRTSFIRRLDSRRRASRVDIQRSPTIVQCATCDAAFRHVSSSVSVEFDLRRATASRGGCCAEAGDGSATVREDASRSVGAAIREGLRGMGGQGGATEGGEGWPVAGET